MRLPIIELIIQDIVKQLKGIRTSEDYYNDVSAVERPNPSLGNADKDRRLVVVQGSPARIEDEGAGLSEWELPVIIICTVVESENSTVSIDQRLNTLRSDVEKRLSFEETSRTRGGLAIDTRIVDPDYLPIKPDAHEGTVEVNAIIHYRTADNDPYNP
jgi:hypothetical protein